MILRAFIWTAVCIFLAAVALGGDPNGRAPRRRAR